MSDTSGRISANAPTAPVASAATRSMSRGATRPATWLLVAATTGSSTSRPSAKPIATTVAIPATTSRTPTTTWRRSARTSPTAVPRIGVISGATIIAPITVAVESATTPAPAITADRTSSTQNAERAADPAAPSPAR